METTYEVWCGRRLVAIRNASGEASEAILAFLSSQGCREDEIVRVSENALIWDGTIYRGIVVGSEESSPERVRGWLEIAALVA